ncbi:hypothetical protein GUA87_01430 [Sneathiella sp. P13V-1]|uniref:hypothetical protein n=1 Tax=Sneathiella sp. P13V-1 TaxID=2697366 RepID=UPI00187B4E85|nr:hypothetical protein [Sneathiella sp. P13V-1]MBE7635489.1 hypothetical protein [Sneathiella sp. P13V-1]
MTHSENPSIERLQWIVDCYGNDPKRWPADERQALQNLASTYPHYLSDYAEEIELQDLLDHDLEDLRAPSTLHARILSDAEAIHGDTFSLADLFGHGFLRPLAGLMTAAALGVMVGWFGPGILIPTDVTIDELALSDSVLDWEQDNENG